MCDFNLFFDYKLKEQCDLRDAELLAMRCIIKRQHEALTKICKLKRSLITKKKRYHYILFHFKNELDALFNIALEGIGGKMKPEVKVYGWSIVGNISSYLAPEAITKHVRGNVESHPVLGSAKGIRSSSIQDMDLKGRRVETFNTIYLLEGPPDLEWVKFLESTGYDMNKLPE